jgi:hypothetical protein
LARRPHETGAAHAPALSDAGIDPRACAAPGANAGARYSAPRRELELRSHDAIWLSVALCVHGLAYLLSAHSGKGERTAEDDTVLTAILLEPDQAAPAEAALEARPAEPSDRATARADRVASVETSRLAPALPETAPTGAETDVPSPTPSGSAPPLEPSAPPGLAGMSNDALGLGTRNVLMGSFLDGGAPHGGEQPGDDERANVAPGIEASLRDALHDHDVAMGYGSGGPLIGPAEELTRASETPWNSTATFEVSADANGQITAVRLVDVTEGWGPWQRVAGNLLGALHDRKLRVPSRGKGMVVLLQVASKRALPSGASPRYEARVGPHPAPKPGDPAPNAQQVEVLKGSTTEDTKSKDDDAVRAPNVIDILSAPFDLSDLGARPMRSVHARVLREKAL